MDIRRIIEKARIKEEITKEECIKLLSVEDASKESFEIRAAATSIIRERNNNAGYLFGQIGLACSPCEANCSFCSFAEDYTDFETMKMDEKTLIEKVDEFTHTGELYGLYLMTMHQYDMDYFLKCVETAKKNAKSKIKIFSNVGDTSYEQFTEMKKAGIDGVYHCWRLGEGKDTKLDPEDRKNTIYNAKKAGLEVLDALEPIGPEHTLDEMAEHILFSKEIETFQCGAMKRIAVSGTPFEGTEQISNLSLSKYVAVQVLVFASMKRMPIMAIHEPNILGYISGANMVCAESGVNPRDTAKDTKGNRGWDIYNCKALLKEAGFDKIMLGDETEKYI